MANIKFSPDEVRGIADEIVRSKEDVSAEVERLRGVIIDDLCANWDGAASDKYAEEFTNLKSEVMDKFVTMLEELDQQLRSIVEAMEQADDDIASKISMR